MRRQKLGGCLGDEVDGEGRGRKGTIGSGLLGLGGQGQEHQVGQGFRVRPGRSG